MLGKVTYGAFSTGSKDQMNRDRCVVQVLIQGVTQNTHVFLQVVPEKTGHVSRSGVDHFSNTLQQISTTRLWHQVIGATRATLTTSHSLISYGALDHRQVCEESQDAGVSIQHLSLRRV